MNRIAHSLVGLSLLTCSVLALMAASAGAQGCTPTGPPCGGMSDWLPGILLVGQTSFLPDPIGAFWVKVADCYGCPLGGCLVELRFHCGDAFPAKIQAPGMIVQCATDGDPTRPIISAYTDAATGIANFNMVGSVLHRSAALATTVEIWANLDPSNPASWVHLNTNGPIPVSSLNEDGVNGVTANDLSLWLCDLYSGTNPSRSDYTFYGQVNLADLALFFTRYFASTSAGTFPRCDGISIQTPTVPDTLQNSLRLGWNDCGTGRTITTSLPCSSNSGTSVVVASFIAPAGVTNLTGVEAVVDIIGSNPGGTDPPLADWWRFDPAGCRAGALRVDATFANMTPSCPVLFDELAASALDVAWPLVTTPNWNFKSRERVRIIAATKPVSPIALTQGEEYAAFTLDIGHLKTSGTGACAGCGEPIALRFTQLKLRQGGGCDVPPAPGQPRVASASGEVVLADFSLDAAGVDADIFADGEPEAVPIRLPATLALGPAVPSPARGPVSMQLEVPQATELSLAVYDLAGRCVRRLLSGVRDAGVQTVKWDRRGDDGQLVRSGIFYVRLVAGGLTINRSVVNLQ